MSIHSPLFDAESNPEDGQVGLVLEPLEELALVLVHLCLGDVVTSLIEVQQEGQTRALQHRVE